MHELVVKVYRYSGDSTLWSAIENTTVATLLDTSAPCTDPGSKLAEPAFTLGADYIRGASGPCAWRPGPLVALSVMPEHLYAWIRETSLLGPSGQPMFPMASVEESVRTAGTLLKRCEGDCNADSDCSGGLKCIQRSALEPVPGCIAGGEGDVSGHDYCSATCPVVATGGTGSVFMVYLVIVILPCGLVLLFGTCSLFGPHWLTKYMGSKTAPDSESDADPKPRP